MPVTYGAFVLCGLALVGVPPLSGGLSKDSVLESVWEAARRARTGGRSRGPSPWSSWSARSVHSGPHRGVRDPGGAARLPRRAALGLRGARPGPLMRWPVVLLAAATVLIGLIGLRSDWLPRWVGVPDESVAPAPRHHRGGRSRWPRSAPARWPPPGVAHRPPTRSPRSAAGAGGTARRPVPRRRPGPAGGPPDPPAGPDGCRGGRRAGRRRRRGHRHRLAAAPAGCWRGWLTGNVQGYLTGLAAGALLLTLAVAVAVTL